MTKRRLEGCSPLSRRKCLVRKTRKKKKTRRRKKRDRRTRKIPRKGSLLCLLYLWTSMLTRIIYEASDRQSNGHNASSYDLSGVWQALSFVPSPSLGDCCKVNRSAGATKKTAIGDVHRHSKCGGSRGAIRVIRKFRLPCQGASLMDSGIPNMVSPLMWPNIPNNGNREKYQQPWQFDAFNQSICGREEENLNFMAPANSMLSYESSANSGRYGTRLQEFTKISLLYLSRAQWSRNCLYTYLGFTELGIAPFEIESMYLGFSEPGIRKRNTNQGACDVILAVEPRQTLGLPQPVRLGLLAQPVREQALLVWLFWSVPEEPFYHTILRNDRECLERKIWEGERRK
ncbi:hypothetical protein PIB30_039178 [Stylosanthes scabra]|uniref:Uncharacterized protein n=1 Tax=Stylosanthes scabra TaxID=79078 RepID=A0ABU6XBW9_9FABA|nr:hypothetical protein [Stylosanthes scabra]